jgi:hypothetical protein
MSSGESADSPSADDSDGLSSGDSADSPSADDSEETSSADSEDSSEDSKNGRVAGPSQRDCNMCKFRK